MAKRQTVAVNLPVLLPLIKSKFRSNVVFCEAMGRAKQKTWVTEWGRNHNLPSPEEAAQMCALLQTTPEEILTEPADIELVNGLIEQERENHGIKITLTDKVDERNAEFIKLLGKLNDAEKDIILAQLRGIAQGR